MPVELVCQAACFGKVAFGICEFFRGSCSVCFLFLVTADLHKQHASVKFCFLPRKKAAETGSFGDIFSKHGMLSSETVFDHHS